MVREDKCVKPAMHLHDLIMLHACRTNLCIICNRVCVFIWTTHDACNSYFTETPLESKLYFRVLKGVFCLLKAQTKLAILAIVFFVTGRCDWCPQGVCCCIVRLHASVTPPSTPGSSKRTRARTLCASAVQREMCVCETVRQWAVRRNRWLLWLG